jgi:hypothetical protein
MSRPEGTARIGAAWRLAHDETGGITVLSLFLFIGMLLVAGFAIDTSNAVKTRANLQIAADMAGHAALVELANSGPASAVTAGLDFAARNAPPNARKAVLKSADIEAGRWNWTDRKFTPDPNARRAVRVTARMVETDGNGLRTFLMKLVGIGTLDLNVASVWAIGPAPCVNGGFVANGIVDMRGNNHYDEGFCVHSNTHVEFQQNNTFDEGSTVSMPNEEDLVIPKSGMVRNNGLKEALRSNTEDLSEIFDTIAATAESYKDPLYTDQPDYITVGSVNTVDGDLGDITASMLKKNAVNVVTCASKSITIGNNELISEAVVVTDCEVKIGEGAALENAVLVTTNSGARSVNAPNGFRLGADDGCTEGGGAQILTLGGMQVASGFEAYGSQVIAKGDIGFTANANGVEGLNMISDGEIDATSTGKLGFCDPSGIDMLIESDELRMVM